MGRILRLLGATWRVEVVQGAERIREIQGGAGPVVFSFWHERAPVGAWALRRWFLTRGVPITILVSHSKDGELGAGLARRWGAQVVRGSASRGGAAGLRRLYRAMKKGSSAITIPDGPRGPSHQAKPGAVVLAQMTGAPIQPVAIGASRAWRARSWDRMIFPKPFARVRVAFGEPVAVPSDLAPPPGVPSGAHPEGAPHGTATGDIPASDAPTNDQALEAWQRHLSKVLDDLVHLVETA